MFERAIRDNRFELVEGEMVRVPEGVNEVAVV
jgi:hypothetical protein